MFTVVVFEILLFTGRLVLISIQQDPGSDSVKFSVNNQKTFWAVLELLEKRLPYKLRRFQKFFKKFLILLKPYSTGEIEKLSF